MNTRDCSSGCALARARGFTLIEVLVALVVTAIGLLGIAKLQALAYASTGSASMRSLVALQTAGLASSMHANRGYWSAGFAPVPVTITGTAISDATLNATAATAGYCVSGSGATPCLPPVLAAFDLHTYATALNAMLGNSNPVTTITCPVAIPVNCTIQVTWNEKAVSINTQGVAGTTQATFAPTYTLYVEP
jgi:type IV pilus assembly protein PilV